jgi:hypothetical protein
MILRLTQSAVVPNIRDGLLLHTGNWTTSEVDWKPSKDMPNSSGCVHAHPSDVERIYTILTGLGECTFGWTWFACVLRVDILVLRVHVPGCVCAFQCSAPS